MAAFLSPAWLAELDAAGRAAQALAPALADATLTIEQVVRGAPTGDVRYHIAIDRGAVRVHPGAADAPDLTFTTDYDAACALARGEANSQDLLVRGRFKVTGRIERLVAYAAALDVLDDAFADVRATTTYPAPN
jgi:alkyl sulfatase BDS1-like metallo-beta-lactamase superfamily hydrolase